MKYALNRYNTMNARGEWCAQSAEQKEIIALAAKIDGLKEKLSKSTNHDGGSSTSNSNSNSYKQTIKQDNPPWMKEPPKEGQPTTMNKNGRKYFWCPTHESWGKHKHNNCRKKHKMEEEAKTRSASASDNNSQSFQNVSTEPELEMNYSAAAFMDTDADTDF